MKFERASFSYSGSPGCGRPSMKSRNSSCFSSSQSPRSLLMTILPPITRWLKGTAYSGFQRLGSETTLKSTWRPRGSSGDAPPVELASSIALLPTDGGVGEGEVAELGDHVALDLLVDLADVDQPVLAVGAHREGGEVGE